NLLPTGDGDDPRGPADSGLGYAWVEFGHRDEHGDCHYFTCGLGASARRGAGTATVQTWQFITALRPGRDLLLSTADRPVEQKELKKIDGVTVLDNATHYRARLAVELFGLDTDAYDNLTELLKQLRRPKLGERLNPTSLAETLREALPPLASNEINQLADGWDRLELLRKAVEQTKESAKLLAQFVRTGWRPWASAVVRRRADRLSSATTALDDTTKARRAAEERLATAEAEVHRVEAELERQHRRRTDLDTELRELLNTPAFQEALGAAQRVESLKETLAGLGEQLARTRVRADESRGAFDRATGVHAKARSTVDESTNAVLGSAGAAEAEAGTAGLLESAKRHLPDRDVASLRADLDRRETRFARLRSLEREFAEARSEAERAGQLVQQLSVERERAARAERDAATAVELAVDTVRARIRDWAADAVVAAPAPEQVEDWCDLVAELTAAPDEAEQVSPYAAIRSHVDDVRSRLQLRRADLLRQRDPLDSERRDKRRELEQVSAATESPPPEPLLWRRRTRPELSAQAGAPFWRCVQPAQGCTLSDEALARLEAVLAASGLLDAWLTVDGRLTTVDGSEVFLGSSGLALARDLGAVLEPTPAGGVANDVVSSVLRGVGWRDTRPTDDDDAWWLAEDGAWRLGPLTGHAEPAQPASYLGATAREAARQRRIEHLRARLAELDALIDELDTALTEADSQLSGLDAEAGRVPSANSVREAVAVLTERRERLVAVDSRLDEAREHHLERELARDSAWAGFAEYAGEHAFPTRELDT
ncbi:MAG: hypothetical protein ACRDQ5_08395, partial [Sciscionella sp.]